MHMCIMGVYLGTGSPTGGHITRHERHFGTGDITGKYDLLQLRFSCAYTLQRCSQDFWKARRK